MSRNLWSKQQQILQELLKEIRKRASHTQKELADELERPQSYVSKYESGERRLDLLEIHEICNACNITLSAFTKQFEQKVTNPLS